MMPKDAFLPRVGSVGIVDDHARSDGLFVYIQTATVAMQSHGASPLPLAKTPALGASIVCSLVTIFHASL
jgi:hypothetical protein